MHTKRQLDRNSWIGRIYFWYWYKVRNNRRTPVHEDTCGVRKALLLSIPAFLIYGPDPIGGLFRPWWALAVAAFAWLSWKFPGPIAQILVSLVLTILGLIILAIVVGLPLTILAVRSRGVRKFLGRQVRRLGKFLVNQFARLSGVVSRPWEWFWTKELIPGKLLYPWMLLAFVAQIVGGIGWLITRDSGWAISFWGVTILEGTVVLLLSAMIVRDKAEEAELGDRIAQPFRTAGNAVARPIRGSGAILKALWKSLKDRVCIPVEWVY